MPPFLSHVHRSDTRDTVQGFAIWYQPQSKLNISLFLKQNCVPIQCHHKGACVNPVRVGAYY